MTFEDLPSVLFLKNVNDLNLMLNVQGVTCNRMLFMMFVDLMIKGCVLLYGKNGRLDLSTISMEQFEYVVKKMRRAGIIVHIPMVPIDCYNDDDLEVDPKSPKQRHRFISKHAERLHTMKDNEPLSEYKLVIIVHDQIMFITFELDTKII
jgi:hypothetical protein